MNATIVTLYSLLVLVAITQANPVRYEQPSSTAQTPKELNGEKSCGTGVISSSDEHKDHTRVKRCGLLMDLLFGPRQPQVIHHYNIGNGNNNVNNVNIQQSRTYDYYSYYG
ncbi:uncharacterized protein LOC112055724 [Bicyclus anynana]|uniref:Uncharacterized protein LOC112055724 n=1 Tax=Bicyclus anynana TaxID=110368 RepID=A0A6J1P1D4_BICAN|nr:uncharacterized protein LOC112055724 [Bicyclus anynana]